MINNINQNSTITIDNLMESAFMASGKHMILLSLYKKGMIKKSFVDHKTKILCSYKIYCCLPEEVKCCVIISKYIKEYEIVILRGDSCTIKNHN